MKALAYRKEMDHHSLLNKARPISTEEPLRNLHHFFAVPFFFFSTSMVAAGVHSNAKILLHVATPTTKSSCSRPEATPACSDIVTEGILYPQCYFAYVLVTDADATAGVAGVQFGVDYIASEAVGIDVFSWHLCADMQFPSSTWPDSASGNLVTWNFQTRCQRSEPGGTGTGVVATAGYFYCSAYTPDVVRIIPRDSDGIASVGACDGEVDVVDDLFINYSPPHLGYVAFSTGALTAGYGPCGQ